MDPNKYTFLAAVVGQDGAKALRKAAERSTDLEAAILPRVIVSWLEVAATEDYEGDIPGVANTYFTFKKAQAGFDGDITIGDEVYSFAGATLTHVAAAVAVSLGVEHERISPAVKDLDLAKLGKSVDLLVKAKEISKRLMKERLDKKKLGKKGMEAQGKAAGPLAPIPPAAPTATQSQQGIQRPKPAGGASSSQTPGLPSMKPKVAKSAIKITKAQATRKCGVCSLAQMRGAAFAGCYCFESLAKSVVVTKSADPKFEFELVFGEDWDRDSIQTLIETLGKK